MFCHSRKPRKVVSCKRVLMFHFMNKYWTITLKWKKSNEHKCLLFVDMTVETNMKTKNHYLGYDILKTNYRKKIYIFGTIMTVIVVDHLLKQQHHQYCFHFLIHPFYDGSDNTISNTHTRWPLFFAD